MNPLIVGGLMGSFVALSFIGITWRHISNKQRFKIAVSLNATTHIITFNCSGQPVSVISTLIHEHGVWFGENNIPVVMELQFPFTISYLIADDGDMALFRLRWNETAKYQYRLR